LFAEVVDCSDCFVVQRLFPDREWRFVEIDVTQADREEAEESIKRLIQVLFATGCLML
jgi:glutaredoxin